MVDLSGSLDSAEKKLPTRISSFKCGKHFSDYPETRFEDNPSMTTCGHKPHGHATRRKKDSFAYKVQVWTSNVPPSASATQRHPAAHSGCRFDDQKSWKKKKTQWRRSGGKQPAEREPPTGRSRCGLRFRPPLEGLAVFI